MEMSEKIEIDKVEDKEYGNKLIIVEKYTSFFTYMYPILMGADNKKHFLLRDTFYRRLDITLEIMYKAIKTNQKGRLYELDGMLAALRWYLRLASSDKVRMMTPKNHRTACIMLTEVGKILNSWIKKKK